MPEVDGIGDYVGEIVEREHGLVGRNGGFVPERGPGRHKVLMLRGRVVAVKSCIY
jgi:hypothetical protein